MSTEVKVAIVTAIGGILVAIITAILGPTFIPTSDKRAVLPTPNAISTSRDISTPIVIPTSAPQINYGSTPTETMRSFCTDLYGGYLQDAYNLFSQRYHTINTKDTFIAAYNQATCGKTNGIIPGRSGSYETLLTINYPNGAICICTYTLIEQDSGWPIDNSVCQRQN